MPRSGWTDLPADVRDAVEAQTGPIKAAASAPSGNHADVATAVDTEQGRVFVKAARKLADRDGPEVWSLRREAAIAPHVERFAPRLLWEIEAGGWLALGFEHVPGRTASFAPGSADLEALALTVQDLQVTPCPKAVALDVEQRWSRFAEDVSPMAGTSLLHTDLNPNNLIIGGDGTVRVVDWALTSRGAAWVEAGQLMPWLIMDGHTPRQADAWATQIPSWRDADRDAIDLYSRLVVQFWQSRIQNRPAPWMTPYLAAWQQWAAYRARAH